METDASDPSDKKYRRFNYTVLERIWSFQISPRKKLYP